MKEIKIDLSSIVNKRKVNGYSREKLSKASGIGVKRLTTIEQRNDALISELIKIANVFEVDWKELIRMK